MFGSIFKKLLLGHKTITLPLHQEITL